MEYLSIKVENVKQKFTALSETGVHEKFEEFPYFSNIGVDHIQGYTQYQNDNKTYYIFTHSASGRDSGHVLITDALKGWCKEIPTPSGWNHPGGIQTIGQYLFVPCEKDNESRVCIYDLEESPRLEVKKTLDFDHNAGCLGITDFLIENNRYYLLLVGDQSKYHAYISEINDSGISGLSFKGIGSISLDNIHGKKIDCQGFGLVTDKNGQVYMIALMSHGKGLTYEDRGYLIKVNATKTSVNYEDSGQNKHFISKGGISGVDGSHFRWGAGIRITPDGRLVMLATSRNIIAGTHLDTSYWAN